MRDENIQSARHGLLVLYVYGLLEYFDRAGEPRQQDSALSTAKKKMGCWRASIRS